MYLNQSGKTARSKTNRFSVYRHDKKRLPILIPEIPWYYRFYSSIKDTVPIFESLRDWVPYHSMIPLHVAVL